jgi:DNA-binding transcriptional regulator GbsR (MarR family)
MDQTVSLNPGEERFIEAMGVYFEGLGAARIGGRMFGLLLLAPRPLALEELAELLKVSRASISTNTRLFIQFGLVEPFTIPGDRRRYYLLAPETWDHRLHLVLASASSLRRLAAMGQAAIHPANAAARDRLGTAEEFGAFLEASATDMMARWRASRKRSDEEAS